MTSDTRSRGPLGVALLCALAAFFAGPLLDGCIPGKEPRLAPDRVRCNHLSAVVNRARDPFWGCPVGNNTAFNIGLDDVASQQLTADMGVGWVRLGWTNWQLISHGLNADGTINPGPRYESTMRAIADANRVGLKVMLIVDHYAPPELMEQILGQAGYEQYIDTISQLTPTYLAEFRAKFNKDPPWSGCHEDLSLRGGCNPIHNVLAWALHGEQLAPHFADFAHALLEDLEARGLRVGIFEIGNEVDNTWMAKSRRGPMAATIADGPYANAVAVRAFYDGVERYQSGRGASAPALRVATHGFGMGKWIDPHEFFAQMLQVPGFASVFSARDPGLQVALSIHPYGDGLPYVVDFQRRMPADRKDAEIVISETGARRDGTADAQVRQQRDVVLGAIVGYFPEAGFYEQGANPNVTLVIPFQTSATATVDDGYNNYLGGRSDTAACAIKGLIDAAGIRAAVPDPALPLVDACGGGAPPWPPRDPPADSPPAVACPSPRPSSAAECQTGADCPGLGLCIAGLGGRVCARSCAGDSACKAGERCLAAVDWDAADQGRYCAPVLSEEQKACVCADLEASDCGRAIAPPGDPYHDSDQVLALIKRSAQAQGDATVLYARDRGFDGFRTCGCSNLDSCALGAGGGGGGCGDASVAPAAGHEADPGAALLLLLLCAVVVRRR